MVLPLLIPAVIGVSTIAGLATPFLFPTPADKATVELNNKLKQGNFTIIKREDEVKTPDFESGASELVSNFSNALTEPKNQFILGGVIILILILVLAR
jgi:hypothetical protein